MIENRFSDMSLDAVQNIQRQQKQLVQDTMRDNYQAKIELMSFIETVSAKVNPTDDVQIKGSRSARKSAKKQRHKDVGGVIDE